ncbi:MAG: hypothetical protein EBY65_08990, partial [Acidimicrobiia bacterium]|nr:hypothetical protein [Acidimicrobiia bacterium]
MPVDTERVAERQRHDASGVGGDRHGVTDRVLCLVTVPEIPLAVRDGGRLDDLLIDIAGVQEGRDTEKGVHRPLAVGRDLDERAGGRFALGGERHVKPHTAVAGVVGEDLAKLVVTDLADVGRPAAEAGDTGHRVGRRAARGLDTGWHCGIERCRPLRIDEGHRSLHQTMPIEKVLRDRRDHVDDGVAHPDDIEGKIGIRAQLRLQPQVNPGRLALRTPGEQLLRRPHRRSRRLASLHSVTDPRLPRLAIPSTYRLELAPDLDAHTFTGTVEIDVEILEPTSRLVLNSIELTIHSASVVIDGTTHTAATTLDDDTERLTLTLDGELAAGLATVQVTFDGTLNDQLHGFYRSTYNADDGTEHTIATTQFQSTDARRCFPCWDEPEYKATFETTLIVDADHLA